MDRVRVLNFLAGREARGERTVLVTIGAVEGSSMRDPGTIMGIAEDGSFSGSLSGGCIETAVVAEAREVLDADEPRVVRFGRGSRYLDIKLPCGGGLDLAFYPLGASDLARRCLAAETAREPFTIVFEDGKARHETGWRAARFDLLAGEGRFGYWPRPKLAIVGHGGAVPALCDLASAMDCTLCVYSPDHDIIERAKADGYAAARLERTSQTELLVSDPWTAFVFLFHDHDWESELMMRALELPHFYFGAMGGQRAHAARIEALRARGASEAALGAIRAPIGLFHSSRDPATLALSTLAEVIRTYQETDFAAALEADLG